MSLALSHYSALQLMRMLRCNEENPNDMDRTGLLEPKPWFKERWSARELSPETWQWPRPTKTLPLHVLVPTRASRLRMPRVTSHVALHLPPKSMIYIDRHCSMVCPELLFLQLASVFSFPALVMLGYELCGHYSRMPDNPFFGDVTDGIDAVTSVEAISSYLNATYRMPGKETAKRALQYVCDDALSVPEAVLGTMYSLPTDDSGYGMDPITLNQRVTVRDDEDEEGPKARYPDLTFSFAPIGINYDGEGHLDLHGLLRSASAAAVEEGENRFVGWLKFASQADAIRNKYLDDIVRNRELAARGHLTLVVTKEDLSDGAHLDKFTRCLLECARQYYGIDVSQYLLMLDDSTQAEKRDALLRSLYLSAGSTAPQMGQF